MVLGKRLQVRKRSWVVVCSWWLIEYIRVSVKIVFFCDCYMKLLYCMPLVLLISFVSAEVTFFEGENMDFFINEGGRYAVCGDSACEEPESCDNCALDCGECVVKEEEYLGGSTGVYKEEINFSDISDPKQRDICFYLSLYSDIDFVNLSEVVDELMEKSNLNITEFELSEYIDNYESYCIEGNVIIQRKLFDLRDDKLDGILMVAGIALLILSLFMVIVFVRVSIFNRRKTK